MISSESQMGIRESNRQSSNFLEVAFRVLLDFRFPEAIAKVVPLWYSHALFPLTPALSLGEREKQGGPRCANFRWLGFSNALPMIPPLPQGEGRGEEERALETAGTRCLAIGSRTSAFSL